MLSDYAVCHYNGIALVLRTPNLFCLQIHLQTFVGTRYSPFLPSSPAHLVAPPPTDEPPTQSHNNDSHNDSSCRPVTLPNTSDASKFLETNNCDNETWTPGMVLVWVIESFWWRHDVWAWETIVFLIRCWVYDFAICTFFCKFNVLIMTLILIPFPPLHTTFK